MYPHNQGVDLVLLMLSISSQRKLHKKLKKVSIIPLADASPIAVCDLSGISTAAFQARVFDCVHNVSRSGFRIIQQDIFPEPLKL
jgi:hypothetical protein